MAKRFIKGSVKEKNGQYGSFFSVRINKEDIMNLPTDDYGNRNITISQRREPGQYGDTHYMTEDTYRQKKQQTNIHKPTNTYTDTDELPF